MSARSRTVGLLIGLAAAAVLGQAIRAATAAPASARAATADRGMETTGVPARGVSVLEPVAPTGKPTTRAVPAYLTREAAFTDVTNGWLRVERWLDTTTGFRQESYPPDGRGDQDGERLRYFAGVRQPFSGRFLLYYALGWDSALGGTPVLLVHGANDNADRAYANPNELGGFGCGALVCPETGLMQDLVARGYRVFAIGFAHKQGDNLMQAQQVGDAIAVITSRLEVDDVDVIGWSKGVMSARAYVSGIAPAWGRGYAQDVRKLVSLGGPNGGYDYPYAHGWAHDFSIYTECGGTVNAPSPHSLMTCRGLRRRHPELSIDPADGWDAYPGQRQMLARWDGVFGLDQTQVDWWTTYYGGRGSATVGRGIQSAIDAGSLIPDLHEYAVPASVRTYLLAGASPTIVGIYNENRGPSDGVVFIVSALDTSGIETVAGTAIVPAVNHLQLGWTPDVARQVARWLG